MKTKNATLVLCLLGATACGRVADVGQDNRSRATRNAVHRMVFRYPKPLVTGLFRSLGKGCGILQSFTDRAAFADGDEIKDGERDHRPDGAAGGPSWSR